MARYFILNQGSFVRGRAVPYTESEAMVHVDKILWYDEGDDEEMRAHLSEDKGKTVCKYSNGKWLVNVNKSFYFTDDDSAKDWWNTIGRKIV